MTTITLTLLRQLLKERPADGHKGTFGQALLIAGQWGMGGASILAARAALATGVGKVCVCLPRRNNDILQVAGPEAVLVHDPSETHFTQAVDPAPFSAVAAGPALGISDDSAQALRSQCVLATGKPLLLDADALNILARHPEWTKDVPDGTVITPGSFHAEGHLRMIKANSGSNIRDLGGWLNTDGNRIRYGLIYRGGELNGGHTMNSADLKELKRLGIGAEVDLREDKDVDNKPFTRSAIGADVFEIRPEKPYTKADLNWKNPLARCNRNKPEIYIFINC